MKWQESGFGSAVVGSPCDVCPDGRSCFYHSHNHWGRNSGFLAQNRAFFHQHDTRMRVQIVLPIRLRALPAKRQLAGVGVPIMGRVIPRTGAGGTFMTAGKGVLSRTAG